MFITNCQVSEKPKAGPVIAQIIIIRNATVNALADPATVETFPEILRNKSFMILLKKLILLYNTM